MNCLYCNRYIDTMESKTTFECRFHDNWDVKFHIFNSINSVEFTENTLHTITLASTNDLYLIHLDVLDSYTQFLVRENINAQYRHLTHFEEVKYITPENASEWMKRILNLKAFL